MARLHGPTADGSTLTSGFQPLLAFMMIPVYWMTDSADAALRIDLLLLVVVDVMIVAVLSWIAFRIAGRIAAVVAAVLWAISPVAVTLALGGLETSLALLCEVSLVAACVWANDRASTPRWTVVGVLAGLAVLARVDALLLVALLAVVQICRGPRKWILPAMIGGALTLAPWWLFCIVTFGTPIPTSGSALHRLATVKPLSKQSAAEVAGAVSGGPFSNLTSLRLRLHHGTGWGWLLFFAFLLALAAISIAWLRRSFREDSAIGPTRDGDSANAFVAVLPAFAAGLMVFYAWFGVGYFFTRYLAPVRLTLTLAIAVIIGRLAGATRRRTHPGLIAVAAAVGILTIGAARTDLSMLRDDRPHFGTDAATGYREPARAVVRIPPSGSVIGAFQSGALSYFADGRLKVINLDGVVNPDAPSPLRPGLTARYMRERHIRWLADWPNFVNRILTGVTSQYRPPPRIRSVAQLPQLDNLEYFQVVEIEDPAH
ncbi:MAG: hypothetical protein M3Q30_04390 [Actinomycetota bacterium]|nr:hypothetical protein [Actinomycetota bacterium]